jgi:hypothetical protein
VLSDSVPRAGAVNFRRSLGLAAEKDVRSESRNESNARSTSQRRSESRDQDALTHTESEEEDKDDGEEIIEPEAPSDLPASSSGLGFHKRQFTAICIEDPFDPRSDI